MIKYNVELATDLYNINYNIIFLIVEDSWHPQIYFWAFAYYSLQFNYLLFLFISSLHIYFFKFYSILLNNILNFYYFIFFNSIEEYKSIF